ncbi:hypothetical protein [Neisseria sicca]
MTNFTDGKPIEQITDLIDEYPINHMFFSTDSDDKSCLDYEKYNAIYQIKNKKMFYKALGIYWFNAEKVLIRAFHDFKDLEQPEFFGWIIKGIKEIERTEQKCLEVIKRYEEECNQPYDYLEELIPIESFIEGVDWKTAVNMLHFFTAKAIFDYVTEFDSLSYEDRLYKFQGLANFITASMGLIELEANEDDSETNKLNNMTDEDTIGKKYMIENARKGGYAKQSPYERAGTITAVNELLEEKQEILRQKGGKTILYKLIRDLIASETIPAPREPTEKTILQWITNFENRKSASYYRKSAS